MSKACVTPARTWSKKNFHTCTARHWSRTPCTRRSSRSQSRGTIWRSCCHLYKICRTIFSRSSSRLLSRIVGILSVVLPYCTYTAGMLLTCTRENPHLHARWDNLPSLESRTGGRSLNWQPLNLSDWNSSNKSCMYFGCNSSMMHLHKKTSLVSWHQTQFLSIFLVVFLVQTSCSKVFQHPIWSVWVLLLSDLLRGLGSL
jgi:hypothetical protein